MSNEPLILSLLPFELQLTIFAYLDVHSIFALSSLSHAFNNLALSDAFYQHAVEKESIFLRKSSASKSEFVIYLQQHLGHASWKQIYKALVVQPYLERKFISMIDFNLLWKPNDQIEYLPRLIRLETCIWVVCTKHYSLSTSIQDLEDTIIMGHHCFATLSQFLLLLIIKYCVPAFASEDPSTVTNEAIEAIRMRVVAILQSWISKNSHDILLNPCLCTAIRQFISFLLAPHHKQQMEKTYQLISPASITKNIEHYNESSKFITIPGPTSRTDSAIPGNTSASPSSILDSLNNLKLSDGIFKADFLGNIGEFNFNNLTICRFRDEDGEEDYEKRNINEVNITNLSPFGNAGSMRIPPMFTTSVDNCTLNILESDPDVIAQELAWFDWELYARVQVSEVMDKSWRHANKLSYSPNIVASIRWFNHVSFWVATEVLNYQKAKQRTQALSVFMQVALKCFDLKDFHSVFSILAGLNMACIQRLHNSWAGMSKKLKDNFIRMTAFINQGVNGDFLSYKNTLKNCTLPAVPYLGCLLYDITFVLDTSENPKFPLIHLHKIAVMSKIVTEITRFQRVPYPPPASLVYLNHLKNVKVYDAGELYRKSMELEPRRTPQ